MFFHFVGGTSCLAQPEKRVKTCRLRMVTNGTTTSLKLYLFWFVVVANRGLNMQVSVA